MNVTFKFYFLTLVSLIVFGKIAQAQTTDEAQVLANEQYRFECMIKRDTAALKQLLAADLVYIHSNALREDKSEHIHSIASGKIIYEQMERSKAVVRIKKRIAIVNGQVLVKGQLNSNPFQVPMLYTAVYQKQKKAWLLVNWQTTRVP